MSNQQIYEGTVHCSGPAIARFPYEIKAIAKERSLEFRPRNEDDEAEERNPPFHYEFSEHCYLGDILHLKGHDSIWPRNAKMNPFTLANGLEVTYGQINGLSADFFGTAEPICENTEDVREQKRRFMAAYDTLAKWPLTENKAKELLEVLNEEVTTIQEAVQHGGTVSQAFHEVCTTSRELKFEWITQFRAGPGYHKLAWLNLDHFGADARIAYNAGHLAALEEAIGGSEGNLQKAYTMNAFADHFLQDSFASGHIRVPRRALHGLIPISDLKAKVCSLLSYCFCSWISLADGAGSPCMTKITSLA